MFELKICSARIEKKKNAPGAILTRVVEKRVERSVCPWQPDQTVAEVTHSCPASATRSERKNLKRRICVV